MLCTQIDFTVHLVVLIDYVVGQYFVCKIFHQF